MLKPSDHQQHNYLDEGVIAARAAAALEPAELGGRAIQAALERSGVSPDDVARVGLERARGDALPQHARLQRAYARRGPG